MSCKVALDKSICQMNVENVYLTPSQKYKSEICTFLEVNHIAFPFDKLYVLECRERQTKLHSKIC